MKHDIISNFISQIAHRFHPSLGKFYDKYTTFFNDGFVELICLIIASAFVWWFSYFFIGLPLVLLLTLVSTPITFGIKYLLHKCWVWKK